MKPASIHLGNHPLHTAAQPVQGEIVTLGGAAFFKISNFDRMAPFLMNIVSNADLWMFISSNGALTAGRRNPDHALFPYYTDDKIHDAADTTGSKTVLLVKRGGKTLLWEPFSSRHDGVYRLTRNLYKNMTGNALVFEEVNHDLELSFRYAWHNCDRFGFVRKSQLRNHASASVEIGVLDGLQNILPAEVERKFQLEYSTLLDGYKKNELLAGSNLGLFTLSSVPTDKAEPSESLKANTVWSAGAEKAAILLSARQLDAFRRGMAVAAETDIHGTRGAYFVQFETRLAPGGEKAWYIVADLDQDHRQVAALAAFLSAGDDYPRQIESEIAHDSQRLQLKIARADGCQFTADQRNVFRHFSNTLFNILRGGIFDNGYMIDQADFRRFIETANRDIARKHDALLAALPAQLPLAELAGRLSASDPGLERLCAEYLPLMFSRRHGDPSRPWNQFSIELKDEAGNKKLDYQGNWRDIFQNWEALALSYPEYIESMIGKFLCASTADGYNPYRVMRDGFDWEVIDPDDPWSYIGYWGDHQIIYLLKLLELSYKYHPGKLQSLLDRAIFTYANVPYRIRPYREMLENPHDTIDFDLALHELIEARVKTIGVDGKYVFLKDGDIYHVNLLEKLLVPVLVKLANFVPGAGIWMNTQRPEWNDANNALVGYGASMVTLCYLRRFFAFAREFFQPLAAEHVAVSAEVLDFFSRIYRGLEKFQGMLAGGISDQDRKAFIDHLGQAGSDYRVNFYQNGFSGDRQALQIRDLLAFLQLGIDYIDHSISANRREDHLYHSYNLIDLRKPGAVSIRRLYEMLEGQVAVLSSGYLSPEASLDLLEGLRQSALYREDQDSYLLYPNRQLPRFNEKNTVPEHLIAAAGLAEHRAVLAGHDILNRDAAGNWHFSSKLRNARFLKEALAGWQQASPEITDREIEHLLEIYETVFDHQSFTGRSGTFYKYEGLGSIYWHMVSKLLLAVQDTFYRALAAQAEPAILAALKARYYEIREGIGLHKNPGLYGAFTTDAYSHTPKDSGAQQPGMTGQVKEDILSRFGEFGVTVRNGCIRFNPALLNREEFLSAAGEFGYYDVDQQRQSLPLAPGMLAFTICQVPVVLVQGAAPGVFVTRKAGNTLEMEGLAIDAALSKAIFERNGEVAKVEVRVVDHG